MIMPAREPAEEKPTELFPRIPKGGLPIETQDSEAASSTLEDESLVVRARHEDIDRGSARDYLLTNAKASLPVIDTVFDKSGRWIYPADETDLYSMQPAALAEHLLDRTESIYTLCQDSLGAINWFGYNDHGPLHIQRVTETGLQFAQQLGLDDGVQRRVVAAAALHDLGNLVSRDVHSLESPEMALAIFPNLRDRPSDWRGIRRAIELHNESVYRKYVSPDHCPDTEQRIEKRAKMFGVDGLLVFMADKVQLLRERVNDKALSPEAIVEHRYSLVNFLFETQSVGFRENNTFEWNIQFRPDVRSSEMKRFADLAESSSLHESGYKAYVPPTFSENYRKEGIRYFETATDTLWRVKKKLFRDVAEGALALGSKMTQQTPRKVKMNIRDLGTSKHAPASITLEIISDNIDELFESKPKIRLDGTNTAT